MLKFIARIVALLLIPCLIIDPASAAGLSYSGSIPLHSSLNTKANFAEEALISREAAAEFHPADFCKAPHLGFSHEAAVLGINISRTWRSQAGRVTLPLVATIGIMSFLLLIMPGSVNRNFLPHPDEIVAEKALDEIRRHLYSSPPRPNVVQDLPKSVRDVWALKDSAVNKLLYDRLLRSPDPEYDTEWIIRLLGPRYDPELLDPLVHLLSASDDRQRAAAHTLLGIWAKEHPQEIISRLRAADLLKPLEHVLPAVRGELHKVTIYVPGFFFAAGTHDDLVVRTVRSRLRPGSSVQVIPHYGFVANHELEQLVDHNPDTLFIVALTHGSIRTEADPQKVNGDLPIDWVRRLGSKGVIFVISAGNEDQFLVWTIPPLDNVLYIAASEKTGEKKAELSNFGLLDDLYLTAAPPRTVPITGTSAAAPEVAAELANLLEQNTNLSEPDAIKELAETAKPMNQEPLFKLGLLGKGILPALLLGIGLVGFNDAAFLHHGMLSHAAGHLSTWWRHFPTDAGSSASLAGLLGPLGVLRNKKSDGDDSSLPPPAAPADNQGILHAAHLRWDAAIYKRLAAGIPLRRCMYWAPGLDLNNFFRSVPTSHGYFVDEDYDFSEDDLRLAFKDADNYMAQHLDPDYKTGKYYEGWTGSDQHNTKEKQMAALIYEMRGLGVRQFSPEMVSNEEGHPRVSFIAQGLDFETRALSVTFIKADILDTSKYPALLAKILGDGLDVIYEHAGVGLEGATPSDAPFFEPWLNQLAVNGWFIAEKPEPYFNGLDHLRFLRGGPRDASFDWELELPDQFEQLSEDLYAAKRLSPIDPHDRHFDSEYGSHTLAYRKISTPAAPPAGKRFNAAEAQELRLSMLDSDPGHLLRFYAVLEDLEKNSEARELGITPLAVLNGNLLNIGVETDEDDSWLLQFNLVTFLRRRGVNIRGLTMHRISPGAEDAIIQGDVQHMEQFDDGAFSGIISLNTFTWEYGAVMAIEAAIKAPSLLLKSTGEKELAFYRAALKEMMRVSRYMLLDLDVPLNEIFQNAAETLHLRWITLSKLYNRVLLVKSAAPGHSDDYRDSSTRIAA